MEPFVPVSGHGLQPRPIRREPAGASLAFRRAAWESVKVFDEGFLSGLVFDLCRCLRDPGWDIVYEPGAILDHVGPHSVGQLSFYNHQLFWYRNLLRHFKKHHSWPQCCILRAGIAAGLMLRAVLALIKPSKGTRWGMFRDYARAA